MYRLFPVPAAECPRLDGSPAAPGTAVHDTPQTQTVPVTETRNLYQSGYPCSDGSPAAPGIAVHDSPQTQTAPVIQTISLGVSV